MRARAAGDWPARLLTAAEACIGGVALVGAAAWLTLHPILLLLFLFGQPLLLVGIALFAAAAVTGRRAVAIERFPAGDHFGGDIATAGGARALTVRAATPVELMRARSGAVDAVRAEPPAASSSVRPAPPNEPKA